MEGSRAKEPVPLPIHKIVIEEHARFVLRQITIVMNSRGIPATYQHMHGFGSHTFSFINANKERQWVKFHSSRSKASVT